MTFFACCTLSIKLGRKYKKKCPYLNEIDGRMPVAVFPSGIGTVFEKKTTNVEFSLRRGLVQGCETPQVGDIHVGPVLDQ